MITDKLLDITPDDITPPIFLCIGSDRVTGDCLGPLVGELLSNLFNIDSYVYGNLSNPITAVNLAETLRFIKINHFGNKVIAIDSSLGSVDEIGKIRVIADGIYPGAGVGKSLPKAGDYSITATIASTAHSKNNDSSLLGVRLGFVYAKANIIAKSISNFMKLKYNNTYKLVQAT